MIKFDNSDNKEFNKINKNNRKINNNGILVFILIIIFFHLKYINNSNFISFSEYFLHFIKFFIIRITKVSIIIK